MYTENLIKNEKIESQLETKSEFKVLRRLGRGAFGQVSLIKHVSSGET